MSLILKRENERHRGAVHLGFVVRFLLRPFWAVSEIKTCFWVSQVLALSQSNNTGPAVFDTMPMNSSSGIRTVYKRSSWYFAGSYFFLNVIDGVNRTLCYVDACSLSKLTFVNWFPRVSWKSFMLLWCSENLIIVQKNVCVSANMKLRRTQIVTPLWPFVWLIKRQITLYYNLFILLESLHNRRHNASHSWHNKALIWSFMHYLLALSCFVLRWELFSWFIYFIKQTT